MGEPEIEYTPPSAAPQAASPALAPVPAPGVAPLAAAPPMAFTPTKSRTTAIILALLLGGLGVHQFYLGNTGRGVLYLLFCWTMIPSLVALYDLIMYATKSDEEFERLYVK